jgi:hypothetical protein
MEPTSGKSRWLQRTAKTILFVIIAAFLLYSKRCW